MPTGDGWYLLGPLIAVAVVGALGAVFWRMGCIVGRDDSDGLAIFEPLPPASGGDPAAYARAATIVDELDDYGLLCPAAVTGEPEVAAEIRRLLGEAGIRSTQTTARDGLVVVLVFREELERARRLVL